MPAGIDGRTPKNAPKEETRAMSAAEVRAALDAVAFREKVITFRL